VSELINNRERQRDELKGIILKLHDGDDPATLKEQFRELLGTAGATEIAELETELISTGLPEEEVKRLCDVHVAIFEDALEAQAKPETVSGHPIHTFRRENDAIGEVVEKIQTVAQGVKEAGDLGHARGPLAELYALIDQLKEMEKHYLREEHLLFPYLEKYGIKGPSSVMWALHDDIRAGWKEFSVHISAAESGDYAGLVKAIDEDLGPLLEMVTSLVYKEENILFPMALERLAEEEWLAIKNQSDEIGYTLAEPGDEWPIDLDRLVAEQERVPVEVTPVGEQNDLVRLDTGALSVKELNLMLTHLPVDITFVDKNDVVRYFSASKDRLFVRTEAVIGRKVQNCHPPKSMHIVQEILDDFKAGRRENADFWIDFGGTFVHIRYFAVRDAAGEYVGTLEMTQDIAPIRALEGERRLLSD